MKKFLNDPANFVDEMLDGIYRAHPGVTYVADDHSTVLTDTEIYAGVIHNGWPARNITAQPWLAETVSDDRGDVVQLFEHELAEIVSHIHGN